MPVNPLECAFTQTAGCHPPFALSFRSFHQERLTTHFLSMESALFLKTPGCMAFHSSSVSSVLSATSVLVPMLSLDFQLSSIDCRPPERTPVTSHVPSPSPWRHRFRPKLNHAVAGQNPAQLRPRSRGSPPRRPLRGIARKTPQEPPRRRSLDGPPGLRNCLRTSPRPAPQLRRALSLSSSRSRAHPR